MPFDDAWDRGEARVIGKIDEVIDLLSDGKGWCKQQLQSGERHCIVGALRRVGAEADLREPLLEAIGQVTGRRYARIEHFNDHPLTRFPLVLRVLQQARENLAKPPSLSLPPPRGIWAWLDPRTYSSVHGESSSRAR
jgi:hypothetical protein